MTRIVVVFRRLGPYHHARLRASGRVMGEGKTGFVVPACDAQAMADAILRFVRHPGLARKMAPACRDAVKA